LISDARKSPFGKAVRDSFLNIFGLEAHDYWIPATEESNPLYPPFLRGNPSNSKHSRDLPVGDGRKNLPLTAFGKEGFELHRINISKPQLSSGVSIDSSPVTRYSLLITFYYPHKQVSKKVLNY
jgi:hypothetical protein